MIWISVIDKLPTKFRKVLTLDANEEPTVCFYEGSNEWHYMGCYDDCCDCKAGNITHWMDIPKAPE